MVRSPPSRSVLWSFRDDHSEDQKRQYLRSGASPTDPVLGGLTKRESGLGLLMEPHAGMRRRIVLHLAQYKRWPISWASTCLDADLSATTASPPIPEREGTEDRSFELIALNGVDVPGPFTDIFSWKPQGLPLS